MREHPPHGSRSGRARRLGAVLGALALAVLTTGCGPDVGADGVDAWWVSIDNQNGREVLLVQPEDREEVDPGGKLPLVVVLHGLNGDAEAMAQMAEWPAAARDRNFIAVFPQGEEKSWDAGGCCGVASEQGIDDMAFLDATIEQMIAEEGADPEQVFLTGYSNGGMMTFRYSCERPDTLAGAASVAGTNFSDCTPTGSVPFLQVSGRDDPVVPVQGGASANPALPEVPEVEESVTAVAEGAACESPDVNRLGAVTVTQFSNCRDGSTVRFDVVDGLDHRYPSAELTPQYVGVDRILDFWGIAPPA